MINTKYLKGDLRIPIFYLLLCAPLLLFFVNPQKMKLFVLLVLSLLVALIIFGKKYLKAFKDNIKNLPLALKVVLVLMVILAGLSFIMSEGLSGRKLFGSHNDYFGLYTWLLLFIAGIFYSDIFRQIISKRFTYLAVVGLVGFSLLIDINNLVNLTGLYSNTFSLGLIASVLMVLSFYDNLKPRKIGIILSLAAVLLSFDVINISIYSCLLIYFVYKSGYLGKYLKSVVCALALTLLIFVNIPNNLSLLLQNRFDLFIRDQQSNYALTGKKTINNGLFVGTRLGEKSLGKTGVVAVPRDISTTLKVSNKYSYTNSLWLNLFRYFGIIFTALFFITNLYLFKRARVRSDKLYLIIFVLLFINTLISSISIEILVLYFMALFGLTNFKDKVNEKT